MKLDVCVFTHNPRKEAFDHTLRGLARQTLPRDQFHVWVVDNGSTPPLGEADLEGLRAGGVPYTLLREEKLGLSYARVTAIRATTSEWLVFVDDDNELFDDYLACVLRVIALKPQLGCIGGKLLLPKGISVPPEAQDMLAYVGIKDAGDEAITNAADFWGPWEPPGAGAVVRRPVAELYCQRLERYSDSGRLGRRGRSGLMSCEDSLMMRGAFRLGLECSYEPTLRLWHHIKPERLNLRYLLRLLQYYGRSFVVLERALGHEIPRLSLKQGWQLRRSFRRTREEMFRRAWCWGYFLESRAPAPAAAAVGPPLPKVRAKAAPRPRLKAFPQDTPGAPLQMTAALAHLAQKGFRPRVVLDAGAGRGGWSEFASGCFPDADFDLIEPVSGNKAHLEELSEANPKIRYHLLAVGDHEGEQMISTTHEPTPGSLLPAEPEWHTTTETVRVATLDSLLAGGTIQPPQLVRFDLQGYELCALEGGQRLFEHAEVFIIKTLLYEIMPGAPLLHELVAHMARRGYVVFDFAGWKRREFGRDLDWMEIVFVRKNSPLVASRQWAAASPTSPPRIA